MNYLFPGHTEMSVDSIHSTIEQFVRNITVWASSQWATICELARKEPTPYTFENLTHEKEIIQMIARPRAINRRYISSLPITKAKYMDLKKLCDTGVILKIFHKEYLNLQQSNTKEVLLDTDIEDIVEENDN
ncbi:unnamed protein product [Euphydryas editha]|uniref:Uncharacterized protein n=1 Tax=Euphydryas editha TaxID=104508 RepID=A0AAU9TSJ5_EUPED|nr:unnamed protein product [Euphydryas editha]